MKRRQFLHSSNTAAAAVSLPTSQAPAAAIAAMTAVAGDINAVTGSGSAILLEQSAIKELSDSLRGKLLLSGYDGYDAARRVLNPTIDRHPALIVQPSGGAIGRVPTDATAFTHHKSIANMFTDGWYTNEVDDHAAKTVNRNYQGNFDRMLMVKNQYDPTNLFG